MTILSDDAFIRAFEDADFDIAIQAENEPDNKTKTEPHAELRVMENPHLPVGVNGSEIKTGLFRVTLRYPKDTGAVPAKQKAEEILEAFRINTIVTSQGQASRVKEVQRESGVAEEGWYKLVLTITFETIINRS